MVVFKLQFTAELVPELLRRHPKAQVLVELHLRLGDRIDEGADQLEEYADVPRHLSDQSATETLGVVVLEDVEDCSCLLDRGNRALGGALEVDDEGGGLLARRRHVNDAVQHEAQVVDLAVGHLGVLLARAKEQAWPRLVVVTENDLLSALVLGRDVVVGEGVGAVLSTPAKRRLQTTQGIGSLPLGSAQVAKQAFAGQPHAFAVGNGCLRGGLGCGGRQGCPLCDFGEDCGVFDLLFFRKRCGLHGCRGGGRHRDWRLQWAVCGSRPFLRLVVTFHAGDGALG